MINPSTADHGKDLNYNIIIMFQILHEIFQKLLKIITLNE